MNDKETDKLVEMLAFIAKEEAKTLSTEEVERMLIHGCKGWIDQPVEEVRKRYQKLKDAQASCAREEGPPVPDYENARKLMVWDEGGEG